MKFILSLCLIYLIGIEARNKAKRKVEKALQRDGISLSSLFIDGLEGGRSVIEPVDHGDIAPSLSKYGHFGLNVESSSGGTDDAPGGTDAYKYAGVGETNSVARDVGSKVEQPSKNVETIRGQLVEIKSQGNQSPVPFSYSQPQYSNVGQSASYYGNLDSQDGLYGPSALGNVQTQSSSYSSPGSNPYYGQSVQGQYPISQPVGASIFAFAPNLDGKVGAPFQQGINQGQYSNPSQPPGFPGFGIDVGQGPYNQNNIQAPQFPVVGTLANPYGAVPGQGAYQPSGIQVQFTNGGPPNTGYYGSVVSTNIHPQNGQQGVQQQQWGQNGQSGVQGLYPGVGQPTNYYGTIPGNNILGQLVQQSYLRSPSFGTPGAPGQIGGQLTALGSPAHPQLGQSTQYQQYVPGLYGGVEKAVISNENYAGNPTIHALSRYINTGFYYPPPQHLNSNPNMWDPEARYYFALNSKELLKDAAYPPPPSSTFPITYSQI